MLTAAFGQLITNGKHCSRCNWKTHTSILVNNVFRVPKVFKIPWVRLAWSSHGCSVACVCQQMCIRQLSLARYLKLCLQFVVIFPYAMPLIIFYSSLSNLTSVWRQIRETEMWLIHGKEKEKKNIRKKKKKVVKGWEEFVLILTAVTQPISPCKPRGVLWLCAGTGC